MKRKVFLFFLIVWLTLSSGCAVKAPTEPIPSPSVSSTAPAVSSGTLSEVPVEQTKMNLKAVWIEYTDPLFSGKNALTYTAAVRAAFDKIAAAGFNAVVLHVRANADAMYRSDYFPFAVQLTGEQGKDPGFDPLEIAVEAAHERGLELHAWINPYRVSVYSDEVTTLAETNPARIWKTDHDSTNDSYVIAWDGQLYFNPASEEVQKLVLNGVSEILDRYEVDGIHFDDYFYPVSDAEFDIGSYLSYCRKTPYPLNRGDWRRANVDALVTAVHRLVAAHGKVFGISPAAPISEHNNDRNYNQYFINVKKWMQSPGYVDYLTPQLYFGYEHSLPDSRFDHLLAAWCSTERCAEVQLYIGLAAYKIGLDNEADGHEWATENNILAREYFDCTKAGIRGIMIYNFSTLFSDDPLNTAERNQLIKQMNGE